MSAIGNPSTKKQNIRKGVSTNDIHRQQNEQSTTQTSYSKNEESRPPRTPAEEAARAARKAAKATRIADELAKQARDAAEKQAKIISQTDKYFKSCGPMYAFKDYNIYALQGIILKDFIREIQPYPVNNPVNYHHWRQIEDGIKQITTLDNCLNVVEYDDGKIHILDGQHRQRALQSLPDSELLKKEVIIHKYRSDEPFSDRTIKLFNRFNTLKPFKIEHKVTEAIIQIIKSLRRDCKGFGEDAIKPTNRDSARQPAMSEKEFSSFLEPLLNELGPGNYTISDIVDCINTINLDYGVQFSKEHPDTLFKSTPKKNSDRKIDMIRIQFYLNTELSRNYWVDKVKAKLSFCQ